MELLRPPPRISVLQDTEPSAVHRRACFRTFVSLLGLPQVDLGDGFEVDVPESDAAVSASCGETLLAGEHAEDTSLKQDGPDQLHRPLVAGCSTSLPPPC